jgi:thioredoxin-dependent peroxiredoxin
VIPRPDACALRDAWAQLSARGVAVLGVSTDDAHSHLVYREQYALPFDLLSDSDELAARNWGVPSEMGFITARQTYLVDGAGNVVDVWLNLADVNEVLGAIDTLGRSE